MERKGLGHIEVIASFMLFIVGVGFTLYYFIPIINGGSDNSGSLDQLMQLAETHVKIYSVIVDNSGGQIANNNPDSSIGVNLNETGKFFVTDGSRTLSSKRVGKTIYFNDSWDGKERVYIVFSEDLDEISSPLNTPSVNNSLYNFGAVQNLNIVSEKKIIELNESYYSNYSSLKEQIGLGNNKNFRFRFSFEEKEIGTSREIPSGKETNAMTKEVDVLGINGIIKPGSIEEEIW